MSARRFFGTIETMLVDLHGRERADEILGRYETVEDLPLTTGQRHALIAAEGGEVIVTRRGD